MGDNVTAGVPLQNIYTIKIERNRIEGGKGVHLERQPLTQGLDPEKGLGGTTSFFWCQHSASDWKPFVQSATPTIGILRGIDECNWTEVALDLSNEESASCSNLVVWKFFLINLFFKNSFQYHRGGIQQSDGHLMSSVLPLYILWRIHLISSISIMIEFQTFSREVHSSAVYTSASDSVGEIFPEQICFLVLCRYQVSQLVQREQ